MKRLVAAVLALILLCTALAGCGKKEANSESARLMFNYDMSEYVTLDTYKIEVDKKSEAYLEYFHAKLRLMMTTERKEGTVENGDTVNIDYEGKKDGVAFEGGTDKGYDLTIGSNSFINGFEEGLIGKAIGSTVDLNLTFPEDYSTAPDLAGKAVVFTVKINSAKRSFDRVNNETAKKCGYKDAAEVMALGHEYAVENYAWDTVYKSARFQDMPKRENRILYRAEMSTYETAAAQNGLSVEELLKYYGYTTQELENELNNETIPFKATTYALSYYILDKEGVKVSSEYMDSVREELEEELGMSIKEAGITDSYVEAEAARKLAIGIVVDNVTIINEEESK